MTRDEIIISMKNCEQTKGMSVYEHGESVRNYFFDLIGNQSLNWRLPDWFVQNKKILLENIHSQETISDYTLFHDCGKPFCKEIDSEGRSHFPNHAHVSKQIWLSFNQNETVANLIGDDMFLHIASSVEINQRLESGWDVKDAFTLLLSALSEIHSNSNMFGGIDSLSFKTKFKVIDRRGKQIFNFFKKEVSNV